MRIDPQMWIPTLLFVAAIALLPAWLVGGAALGTGVGLWLAIRHERRRAERANEQRLRAAVHDGKVIPFRKVI